MRMQPAPHRRNEPAPCRVARRLLAIAVGASLLIALGIAADLLPRASDRGLEAGTWMQALCLSAPALYPAGSPGRHPGTIYPAVDLRFTNGLEILP